MTALNRQAAEVTERMYRREGGGRREEGGERREMWAEVEEREEKIERKSNEPCDNSRNYYSDLSIQALHHRFDRPPVCIRRECEKETMRRENERDLPSTTSLSIHCTIWLR